MVRVSVILRIWLTSDGNSIWSARYSVTIGIHCCFIVTVFGVKTKITRFFGIYAVRKFYNIGSARHGSLPVKLKCCDKVYGEEPGCQLSIEDAGYVGWMFR